MMSAISADNNKEVLAGLPSLPGVYRYFDEAGTCLYVGKARDLKRRVSSYFRKTGQSPRIALMVQKIARLETTVVRTEAEALLLENNLIKTLNPKYNILFRDDKSYPYLKISEGPFARVSYYRGAVDRKNRYFGPYPNGSAVREAIGVLQKVFHLRTCEEAVFRYRTRPCLMGQMGRCSAPCIGKVTADEYARDVEDACAFLHGKTEEIMQALTDAMMNAAEDRRYEEAAVLRDRISLLRDVMHQQAVETTGGDTDADIIAVLVKNGAICVNLAVVRGGRHLGDHAYFPDFARNLGDDLTESEVFEAFISHHYCNVPVPDTVISQAAADPAATAQLLSALANRKVAFVHEPQLTRRKWYEMAVTNAVIALDRHIAESAGETKRIDDLINVLSLELTDQERAELRIECFDISHTAGEATQASCVVFDANGPLRAEYRRYNITGITPGDDYAAMNQVLRRRYGKAIEESKIPDVILIDGGKGQLGQAKAVFAELDVPWDKQHPLLLGVAKGADRKAGLETLFFEPEGEGFSLPPDSPALHVIQHIRDESHDHAISGHRKKRAKVKSTSTLETIEGVGPKRRQMLLKYMGGLQGLRNASIEEIAKVPGISQALAEKIFYSLKH